MRLERKMQRNTWSLSRLLLLMLTMGLERRTVALCGKNVQYPSLHHETLVS